MQYNNKNNKITIAAIVLAVMSEDAAAHMNFLSRANPPYLVGRHLQYCAPKDHLFKCDGAVAGDIGSHCNTDAMNGQRAYANNEVVENAWECAFDREFKFATHDQNHMTVWNKEGAPIPNHTCNRGQPGTSELDHVTLDHQFIRAGREADGRWGGAPFCTSGGYGATNTALFTTVKRADGSVIMNTPAEQYGASGRHESGTVDYGDRPPRQAVDEAYKWKVGVEEINLNLAVNHGGNMKTFYCPYSANGVMEDEWECFKQHPIEFHSSTDNLVTDVSSKEYGWVNWNSLPKIQGFPASMMSVHVIVTDQMAADCANGCTLGWRWEDLYGCTAFTGCVDMSTESPHDCNDSVSSDCVSCGEDGNCIQCEDGFFLDGLECVACNEVQPDCNICSADGSECLSCAGDLVLDESGDWCVPCADIEHCNGCLDGAPDQCSLCDDGYDLSNDKLSCVESTGNCAIDEFCPWGPDACLNSVGCAKCSASLPGCDRCESNAACNRCEEGTGKVFYLAYKQCFFPNYGPDYCPAGVFVDTNATTCPADQEDPGSGGGGEPTEPEHECLLNSDCAANHVCEDHKCVENLPEPDPCANTFIPLRDGNNSDM